MKARWTSFPAIVLGSSMFIGLGQQAEARVPWTGPGAVYTLSNAVSGNQILEYRRSVDGSLTYSGAVASGGTGTGANLGSQGAVVLSDDRAWLFAVNAGSNSISSFSVHPGGLVLADTAPSGGTTPVSLTVRGHLLYVLNQGGTGNITGFWVGARGHLKAIPGSTLPLSSSAAGAAEVAFSPNQETLVVSEKNTMTLDTYKVRDQGLAVGPTTHPSNGAVPYGFTFTGRDELLVTEAGSNAVSSYDLDGNTLATESASVPSQGAAPCWIAATPDGSFAYATNAHVGTIAGFSVGREGALNFLGLTPTPSIPVLDIASASRFVYALAAGTNQILAYRVRGDGSLAPLLGASGLPVTAVGLAAR
ncbi:beta-propeller fold lactonase family protein [Geothrix sp. 21YS21S-2]|uniref:lactonase family protein n=1 Tax=Geothrix sp. 21YS21S-2 TaxID=3068893 RepID=UPI0027B94FFD|nr:beta-propeller fold lactonase family protein [Geothrix sp. 21YS21S-2]